MLERPVDNLDLIKRVLGDEYLELHLDKLSTSEEPNETRTEVSLELSDTSGRTLSVGGLGVGPVDATFNGLLERYGAEYQSLRSIELTHFRLEASLDTKKQKMGVDSIGRVILGVRNSEGRLFEFADKSRSISRSSVRAVLAAGEYFVNAERAFIALHRAREDAMERKRDDLVTRYTQELAEVVGSTSYTEVIENMKKDITSF